MRETRTSLTPDAVIISQRCSAGPAAPLPRWCRSGIIPAL